MVNINVNKMNDKQKSFWERFLHAVFEQLQANAEYESRNIKTIKFFTSVWRHQYSFFIFSIDTEGIPINNIAFACNPEMVSMPDEEFISIASDEEKSRVLNDFLHVREI